MTSTNEGHVAQESYPHEAAPTPPGHVAQESYPHGAAATPPGHVAQESYPHGAAAAPPGHVAQESYPQGATATPPGHVAQESYPHGAAANTPPADGGVRGEDQKVKEFGNHGTFGSSTTQPQTPPEEDLKKWGTHQMGAPAAPNVHQDNQQAAHWQAQGSFQQYQDNQQPYVEYSPMDKPADSPCEYVVNMFNSWSHKSDGIAGNIWKHLKTGPSMSGTAWGKVNLTAKAMTGGGFEPIFRQIFATDPNEKLKKTFVCYLSTTTGPVAGTLYLSTARVAFCSDRPLTFRTPSGQDSWTYYKLSVPIENVEGVNPMVTKQKPPEKYLQIITNDRHEFWFMGFVSFEKAINHMSEAVSASRANATQSGHEPREAESHTL